MENVRIADAKLPYTLNQVKIALLTEGESIRETRSSLTFRRPGEHGAAAGALPERVQRSVCDAPAVLDGPVPEGGFLCKNEDAGELFFKDCRDAGSACSLVIDYGGDRAKVENFVSDDATRRAL